MNAFKIYLIFIALSVMAGLPTSAMDSRSLFDQGMEAYRSGNYGSSELLFKKIINSGEEEYIDRAWFYRALSIFNRKKYDAALFEFKNFLNRCRTDELAVESRYWTGECYFNLSDYPNAIEEYKRFITRGKEGGLVPKAHDRIGAIYLKQKRYDEAVLEWESAISKSSNLQENALRRLWIGDAYFRNGKLDEALQKFSLLVSGNADVKTVSMARMLSGRIYQERQNHHKALQMFNAVPEHLMGEEPFGEVLFYKARSYGELGDFLKARSLLEIFLHSNKSSPWYYDGLYELGRILIGGTARDEGIGMLEQVRAESKDARLRANASLLIGNLYLDQLPEKAIPCFKESLKDAEPGERNELLVLLGKTCLKVKKYDEAVEFFDTYLKENPFNRGRDEVNFFKARVYLEMGNIDAAVHILETIRKDNPFSKFNIESGYYLGLIEYNRGDMKKAAALLLEYLKQGRAGNTYDAYVLLIQLYVQKGEMENAGRFVNLLIRDFLGRKGVEVVIKNYALELMKRGRTARNYIDLIVSRFPESEATVELYLMFGDENFSKGNYEAALGYYERCLAGTHIKDRGNAFYKKILSLFNLKRYGDVIATIKKGNFPPMNEVQWTEIPLIQARSYYLLKRYDEVYLLLDIRHIRDFPKEDVLMYIKGALHVGDQRSAMEANEYLESDKQLFPESLYIIGDFFLKSGNLDEAELFFSRIINECPGNRFVDYAKVSIAEIYARNKKFPAAVNLLSEVSGKEMQSRKNAQLIACYFEMKSDESAIALTREHLNDLLAGQYGEEVVKYNLSYYYKKRDLQHFDQYVKYLSRYGGNELLINHLSAKIYFETGNYRRSYNYFYALSKTKNRYAGEALYHLGIFSLLVNRSATHAVSYFSRLADMPDADPALRLKAMIQCAIIFKELNDDKRARACLLQVLSGTERGLPHIQASNLYEAYGYSGK